MKVGLSYDNIPLPKRVSEILEHDFWLIDNVGAQMVKAVTSPVKFSAYTSIYLQEGSCSADINLIPHKITAPAFVNIRSTHIMQPYDATENFKASFIVLSKRLGDALISCFNDVSLVTMTNRHPVVELSPEMNEAMTALYRSLKEVTQDQSLTHPFHAVLHTLAAFFYRYGVQCFSEMDKTIGPMGIANHIVEKFLMLVQQNFRKERFLDFYAERLEISTKHLSRIVKEHTGYSATEWITRYVILEAKVMLSSSTLNIQQISEELNFPSQSFFGKYFKKAVGVSPKEFRNGTATPIR